MKRKDYFLIAIIAVFSAVLSIILSNMLISSGKNRSLTAEVVEPITSEFVRPDKAYFNDNSLNPTQLIKIAPNTDSKPFGQQ